MKKFLFTVLVLAVLLPIPGNVNAQTFSGSLMLFADKQEQSTSPDSQGGTWGNSYHVQMNALNSRTTFLAGKKYARDHWWVAILGGVAVDLENDSLSPVLYDVRAGFNKGRYSGWSILSLAGFSEVYNFVELDYQFRSPKIAFGVETENFWGDSDALSVGAHLKFSGWDLVQPVLAYQVHMHGAEPDQVVLRMNVFF